MGLGADRALSPGELSPEKPLFDTGLDTTGLKPVIENLIALTRSNVAIFGVLRERIEFGPEKWWGNFKLMGYGEHNKSAARRALKLVTDGLLDLAPLISRTCTFETYAEAIESLRRKQSIKVLVRPGR
jgi:threonine dehydrogenase-like Zn-dependent dehydrogenase